MVDVNEVFDKIGVWHIPVLASVIVRSVPLGFHLLQLSFAASPKQDHWCARPANFAEVYPAEQWKKLAIPLVDGKYSRCLIRKFLENNGELHFLNETQKCSDWEFDTTYYDWTLVREFGMVCDKSWLVSASQSLFMIGLMVGNMIFARVADRLGRRRALLWATLLMLVASTGTVFCRDYWSFNVTRVFTSIALGGYQCVIVSILVESLSVRKRMLTVLAYVGFTIACIITPWVAYFLRNWVHQQIVYAASSIPMLIVVWFLPESPRWLLASGRVDEAEVSLANVVRLNKVKNVDLKTMFSEYRQKNGLQKGSKEDGGKVSHATYADLFRGSKLRICSLSILFMYFANRLLLFHITFFSARMGGDPYWGFTLVSLLALPADISSLLFVRYAKRRPSMVVSFVGVAILLCALLPVGEDSFMARVVIFSLAKVLIMINTSVLGVFATESFPTVVRAMGIGSAYTVSRLGAMLSPFFKELTDFGGQGACAGLSAIIAVIGAVAAFVLPETLNQPLPDTLADVDPGVGKARRDQDRNQNAKEIE